MDPIGDVQIHLDSTFAIMLEAQRRGHEVLVCEARHLLLKNGIAGACVQNCKLKAIQGDHAEPSEAFNLWLSSLDVVFMRTDPPFNMDYIYATYILEAAEADTLVVNRACNLRNHNEKLYSLEFPQFCPESLIAADAELIFAFMAELESPVVIKPLDGNGGKGIFLLRADDPNRNVILEMSTDYGRHPVMAQRYVPEAVLGDKRILIIDGEFQGAVLRVPGEKDPRGNIHVGARCEASTLTPREHEMVAALGPRLRDDGHIFVGIDVIGDYLTEINVTSPTCIHEINAFDGRCVEGAIMDAVEKRVNG
jgi:glutathione synthase